MAFGLNRYYGGNFYKIPQISKHFLAMITLTGLKIWVSWYRSCHRKWKVNIKIYEIWHHTQHYLGHTVGYSLLLWLAPGGRGGDFPKNIKHSFRAVKYFGENLRISREYLYRETKFLAEKFRIPPNSSQFLCNLKSSYKVLWPSTKRQHLNIFEAPRQMSWNTINLI